MFIIPWFILIVQSVHAQLYTLEWPRIYPERKLELHGPFLATEDNSFAYGICDSDGENSPNQNCQLIREKKLSENIIFRKTCSIPADHNDLLYLWPVTLNNNGKHLIISCKFWQKENPFHQCLIKIRSVDMTNCQVKLSPTNILNEGLLDYVWYPYSFEIFYVGNSSTGRLEGFRTMFDAEGNQIGQPSLVLPGENFTSNIKIYPVRQDSPAKGYFVTYMYIPSLTPDYNYIINPYFINFVEGNQQDRNVDTNIKILYIDSKGKSKVLLNKMIEIETMNPIITGSNDNSLLSMCWTDRAACKKVECYQYDANFKLILNETFTFVTKIRLHKIHNLPGGGFLMFVGHCPYNNSCDRIEVFRVEADGTRERSIEISGFQYIITRNQDPVVEVIETANKEFCFYIYNREETQMKYARTCFPKRYLL